MRSLHFLLAVACSLAAVTRADYTADPDSKPITAALDAPLYDVAVLNASDGFYYLTGTWIGRETRTPLWRSTDLADWTFVGEILRAEGTLTAPELYEVGAQFFLLVTEQEGTALYRADRVDGPYTLHTRFVTGIKRASLFFDDATPYLVHGGGHIVQLSADLRTTVGPTEFLHPSFDLPRPAAPGWATEKAQLLRVGTDSAQIIKANGRYYLLASERITRLNDVVYDVLCASSESLFGPYTERRLAFMHAGGGTVFQAKDGRFLCAFAAQADDEHVRINQRPVIVPTQFNRDDTSIGYTGEFYFEREPIGNVRNRLPGVQIRDPSICAGPDGWYYLVGTENWVETEFGKPRIMLRRSRDLKTWEDVNHLVRCEDLGTQHDGSPLGFEPGEPVMMWAPEIQYIRSQKKFLLSVSIPRIRGEATMQTWIFQGDRPEGPFRNVSTGAMHTGIDGFFFEDDDGQVYYLYGANHIAPMNADLTGFAGPFRQLLGLHGIEGTSLVKIDGSYLLARADNTGGPGTASYEAIYGVADNVYGPYHYRGSVAHCGHTTMFHGHDGQWRLTMFGSDSHAPVHHGLGILQFDLDEHGRVHVREDR